MGRMLVRLLALVVSLAIMLLFNVGNGSLLWSAFQNVGHFLIFIALTFFNLALFRSASLRVPLKHLAVVLTLFSLGGFVELVQSAMPGRTASWSDLLLDTAGIFVGYLLFLLAYCFRSLSITTRFSLVFCILVTGFLASKPVLELGGYHLLKTGPPAIIAFSDPFVAATISVTGGAITELNHNQHFPDSDSKRVLRIDFAQDGYNGVVFHDTNKQWMEARYLNFMLHNTSAQNREMAIRIHDRHHNNEYHDRYNMTFLVKPGANAYRFSIADIKLMSSKGQIIRQLDMQNIHEIQLFSLERDSYTVYLSDLLLTQQ